MAEMTDIREQVRERYAAAARTAAAAARTAAAAKTPAEAANTAADSAEGCCGSPAGQTGCCGGDSASSCGDAFGGSVYEPDQAAGAPQAALNASLGCGVPTAVAELHEGETVLDLGSGAGADVLIAARRVGPTGTAIGLDMTDEMLALARANAAEAGVENARFLKGYIEDVPLDGGSVDVVISNCVINLAADKRRVLAEAARVLRPGGRLAVSDVIASEKMDAATRGDMEQWTGCVAGALTEAEYREALAWAGFVDVEVRETAAVHEHAAAAVVRATAG